MSTTNKAFERYMGQANDGDILSIYRQSAEVMPLPGPDTELKPQKIDKYLKSWWRRRESNPRPEIFRCTFYARIFCFEFRP